MGRPYTYIQILRNLVAIVLVLVTIATVFAGVATLAKYLTGQMQQAQQCLGIFLYCLTPAIVLLFVNECLQDIRTEEPRPTVRLSPQEEQFLQDMTEASRDAHMPQMRRNRLATAQPGRSKPAPTSSIVIGHPIRKHSN